MAKSSKENSNDKRWKHLVQYQFKKGHSGNPKGYPKGQRNFHTIFRSALRHIAEKAGMDETDIEDAMTVKAIEKAVKGDFFYYRELNDRLQGKPKTTVDLGGGGKSLAELIVAAHVSNNRGGRTKANKAPGKNSK